MELNNFIIKLIIIISGEDNVTYYLSATVIASRITNCLVSKAYVHMLGFNS